MTNFPKPQSELASMASPREIRRVLVANRGDIALRIIRTLRRMGIQAVAITTSEDTSAHGEAANSTTTVIVRSRAAPRACGALTRGARACARQSYTDAAAIVAVAKEAGCDALHPGCGFLSERCVDARSVCVCVLCARARACVCGGGIWLWWRLWSW